MNDRFMHTIRSVLSGLIGLLTLTPDYALLRPELLRCGALPLLANI